MVQPPPLLLHGKRERGLPRCWAGIAAVLGRGGVVERRGQPQAGCPRCAVLPAPSLPPPPPRCAVQALLLLGADEVASQLEEPFHFMPCKDILRIALRDIRG